jgi:hypothetical protein
MGLFLVSTASVVGIVLDDGGDPYRVTSLRGQAVAAAMTFVALSIGQVLLHLSFGRENTPGIVQVIAFALVASVLSFLAFQRIKG